MAYVSPFEDAPTADAAQLREASGANDNVLTRSLRGGVYGAGSQLLSTGAAVADAVGADEVGGYLHGQSKGLRDTAALPGNAPRVGSYSQLRDDFSMDNLGEYVGGLVGGSLPMTAAGIAGGMATGGAGFVPAMLGAGAATLPFNVGEVVQRQQADPQALQQSAGQRLGEAVLGGAGASAVESLVPGLVGRQILGKGVGNLAKESFKQMAGRNAMDIPLEGLTEGAGTAVKQFATNQDKPLDWNEIKEGAIGGAAAGSVFTGVGTAADAMHSVAPKTGELLGNARTSIRDRLNAARNKVGEQVDKAEATAPGKKIRGVFDDVTDMLDRGKQKFDDTLDKVMRGEELGSPADWLAATTDEAKKRMTDFSDSERVKAATSWAKEMLDDAGLDAAKRADITDALKNATDRTSQMTIAGLKKTWDLSRAGAAKIKDLADAVGEEYNNYNRRDVDVESRTVDEEPAAPSQLSRLGLSAKAEPAAPDAPAATTEPAKMTIKEFAAARKAFISKAMQDDPELSPEAARELFNTSQNDGRISFPTTPTPPKLSEDYSGIHKVIADAIKNNGIVERRPDLFDTPAKINTMASTMRMLMDQMTKGPVKLSVMKKTVRLLGDDAVSVLSTLKDAMKYDADPQQAERFFSNINTMMDIEKGETALHEVMAASMIEQKTHPIAQDADVLLAHARGKLDDNAPRSPGEAAVTDRMINEFYARTYGDKADVVRAAVEKAAALEGRARSESKDRLDENGAAVEDTHHSEGGFDESGARLEAGARDMQVYGLTKPDTKGNSKSQLNGTAMHKDSKYAKQHMLDVRAKFPDVDSNGDYTHEVRFEQLPGSEYGHIVVEKYDNSKEFNETDLEAMKLDTHKYPDSKSRIEVAGHIIDAVKVASTMRGKLQGQFESGATTAKGRLAEGFKHGLSMLMTQFGERVKVGDSAVIGYVGGMPFTWGEAQKLDRRTHADKMNDVDVQEMTQLRKEFKDAKNAGAEPEVLKEILDAYKELEGNQRAAKDKELGRGEDYQGRSMKRQRPPATRFQDHMPPTNAGDAPVRGVYPAVSIEVDPETGAQRTTSSNNLNGESKDDDGVTAKDKDGNIHALGDNSEPVFGGNDKNRVTRKPWGSVDKQDGPQIPAKVTSNAKEIRNKQLDLAPKDENVHRSNMDGSGHFVSPTQLKHNNLVAAIGDWDGEASAGAAKLKARAQTLLANFAMMSQSDQRRFSSIAPEDVKAGRDLKPVKFTPMSMADARSIVNDLAVKYKDRILPPGEKAQSVPTKQVTTHERNPVQFYNDGKAGVRGPEKAAAQPAAKTSINEGLVDKVVLSENYPTTVAGAEKFLNAAKKRFEALKAEDQRVLNDDDHPTQRLPEAEQKVLDALHQTFDKNSDLAPFFTELDGWDAVPEAEQIRLMKFAESLTEGKPDPKPVAAKKAAFLERAASGDKALIEELKTSTDAKGLQRALELLNDHELDFNEASQEADNVMDTYDVLNDRLAELVGGSEDVAYGLQTRKYSLMSTSIHDDLGRDGFAATHDSPIKHEGRFDWRAHRGKGEGNAAFGAGTYLSTADGVHRSYKDQFTAKLNRHIRDSAAMLELREQLQEARDDANHYLEILQDGIKFGVTVIKMGSYETREEAQAALDAEIDSTKAKLAEYRKMLLPENEGKYNADGVNRNIDYLQNEKLPRLRTEKITDYEAELKAAEAREDAIGRKLDEERAKLEVHKPPTYHVSVDIKKEQLLDWDKPAPNELLGDPTVRDALDAHYHVKGNHYSEDKVTGGDVYRALTMQLGYSKGIKGKAAQAAASDHLQSLGILGHKYNASGGRDEEHPNYVIYDDSKITTNYVHFDKTTTNPNKSSGPRRRLSVEQHIEKVLGKSVRVAWQAFTHAGQYTHAYGKGLIELSVHALNPMSTAYHESLHAFFAQLRDAGATDITHVLNKAAASEHVMAQLKERFKNEPAVLAQLKDPEERAAYMYQMWASDPTFKVNIAAKNVFQKIAAVIRKALGIWSNDERALHIMEYFHSGEYAKAMGTPNAVRRALMETGTNRALEAAKTFTEPLGRLADAMVSSGDARLRDTNIPALIELADKIKRPGTEIGGDQGFIPAARIATTKRLGEMAAQLEGYTPEQLKEALEALQSGLVAPSPEGRLAVRAVKDILARTKAYMEGAGVELGDLGPDYFPRVWDPHFISQNEQAMQDMLQPYVRSGEFKGNPTEFIRRLTSREGNEFGIESRKPGMQHTKTRDLAFLKNEDVAPFLNKDLMGTLASYIGQAARRAEWERRLGGGKLETLLLGARGEGATNAQMAMVEDYLEGVDGTLGDDINPTARRLMGNMIVYQNIRLLPMAMFSMLVDPMGILVRGGTVAEAWGTFKRGMASIPVTYGKKAAPDFAEQVAELVGVVDNAMLTSVMGDLYTQGMVGGTAKKINNAFFKYNMVEGLNRAFRVGASEAAIKFMARHADGTQSTHSARWMAELGLRPGDIKVLAGGHIALTQAAGLTRAQEQRVHAAINQWVDGAMLRPDAADKPIWMNDPHYALISHLKQFVFTFQKVILGRMVHELRNGNYVPAMALATYVPVMIAADAAKGLIQGGGDVPEWKKGWGVADYVGHGVQRAGLFGVGQFGVDVAEDVKRGGSGFGALSGPTLEQLADAVQLMNGHKQFGSTLLDAMPANALYKESLGGHGEAKADPAVPH